MPTWLCFPYPAQSFHPLHYGLDGKGNGSGENGFNAAPSPAAGGAVPRPLPPPRLPYGQFPLSGSPDTARASGTATLAAPSVIPNWAPRAAYGCVSRLPIRHGSSAWNSAPLPSRAKSSRSPAKHGFQQRQRPLLFEQLLRCPCVRRFPGVTSFGRIQLERHQPHLFKC